MKITTKQVKGEEVKEKPLPSPALPSDTFASLYAEETLLGTLLNNPSEKELAQGYFDLLEPSDFQDIEHQLLFSAIKHVFEKTGRILPADVIKLLRDEFATKKISIELFSRLANVIIFSGDLSFLIYEIKKTSILKSLEKTIQEKFKSKDSFDVLGIINQCEELLAENKRVLIQLDKQLLNGKQN